MSSPRIIAMRTKAFPNYAIHYNYALKLLFSWRCQWRALQFLNSTVLMGIHEHLRCSCVRIPIEANHGAVSVHAELWYPFPHNKKKKEEEKGKKTCLNVHASIALMDDEFLREKNWSFQFNTSKDIPGFLKMCGLNLCVLSCLPTPR